MKIPRTMKTNPIMYDKKKNLDQHQIRRHPFDNIQKIARGHNAQRP